MLNFPVTLCYKLLQPRKAFPSETGYIEDRLDSDYNRVQRRDVMKTHMVMDTICTCFALTLMLKIFMTLASYSNTVQLLSTMPRELLYVAASPFVF
jgi:hypothetical protein